MKVAELIKQLSKLDPTLEVHVLSCKEEPNELGEISFGLLNKNNTFKYPDKQEMSLPYTAILLGP